MADFFDVDIDLDGPVADCECADCADEHDFAAWEGEVLTP